MNRLISLIAVKYEFDKVLRIWYRVRERKIVSFWLIDKFDILSIIGVKIWKICYNDKNLM